MLLWCQKTIDSQLTSGGFSVLPPPTVLTNLHGGPKAKRAPWGCESCLWDSPQNPLKINTLWPSPSCPRPPGSSMTASAAVLHCPAQSREWICWEVTVCPAPGKERSSQAPAGLCMAPPTGLGGPPTNGVAVEPRDAACMALRGVTVSQPWGETNPATGQRAAGEAAARSGLWAGIPCGQGAVRS